MKRIFLILLVCCIASLKAVGQNEVFIYEMTSFYKIQEEKEYQVGSGFMRLRLRFLPEKKLEVAGIIRGEYYKMDDGRIIEDSYNFYKVDEEGNAYVVGFTNSPNFPTTDNAIMKTKAGIQMPEK